MNCFFVKNVFFIFCLHSAVAFHPSTVDEFTCQKCNSSSFCYEGKKFQCPEHSTALHFAFDISHCICDDGYLRTSHNTCVPGLPPYYYKLGIQKHCSIDKHTVNALASQDTDCVCKPGFFYSGTTCFKCSTGKYNELSDQSSCSTCPHNSHSHQLQSSNITSCLCNAGYSGAHGGPCLSCEAGYYKSAVGSSACIGCALNQYSSEPASTVCMNCTLHAVSPGNSASEEACECVAGFSKTIVQSTQTMKCQECPVGHYKNKTANEECALCSSGKYANVTALTTCFFCNENEVSLLDRSSCVCNIGYFLKQNTCTECARGTFKDSIGSETCQSCLDVAHTSNSGSVSISDCFCNAGYSGDQFECAECAAGFFKDFVSTADNRHCLPCPANTTSEPASFSVHNCSCIAGHGASASGQACQECSEGKFRAGIASEPCALCTANTFQNQTAQTFCFDCQALSTSQSGSDSIEDCICVSGSVRLPPANDPRCSTCSAGTYATNNGCNNCSSGTFSVQDGVTECSACPMHGTSQFPFTSCSCLPGYYCSGLGLGGRLEKSFVTSTTGSMPSLSTVDYVSDWSSVVTWIDENVVSDSSLVSECHFSGKTYAQIYSILQKHPCPVQGVDGYDTLGQMSAMLDCILGIFQVSGNSVLGALMLFENPSNPSNNGLKFSNFEASHLSELLSLQCMNTQAAAIPAQSAITFSWGQETCADCLIRTSNNFALCTSCLCSEECLPCPANTYKNFTGTAACVDCQSNSQSVEASAAESDCQCSLGFQQQGPHACVPCDDGSYADSLDINICNPCPFYHITPQTNAPYTDISDCQICTFCGPNQYVAKECEGSTDTTCASCRSHSSTLSGTLQTPNLGNLSCQCNSGYEFKELDLVCVECKHAFYKSSISNELCIACNANENTSSPASVAEDDCLCNFGYGYENGVCVACAVDEFKASLSDNTCKNCPSNMNTDGEIGASSCLCASGFRKLVSQTVFSFSCCDEDAADLIEDGIYAWDNINGHYLRFKGFDSGYSLKVTRDDWPDFLTKPVPKVLWDFVTDRYSEFPSNECDSVFSNIPCKVSDKQRCQGAVREAIGCPAYVMSSYWRRNNDSVVTLEKISISYSSIGDGHDAMFPAGWYATCVRDNAINMPSNCPQFWANYLLTGPQIKNQNLLMSCGADENSPCTYQTNQAIAWPHHEWCIFTQSCATLYEQRHTFFLRSKNNEYLWVRWDLGKTRLISQILIQAWYWETGTMDPPNNYIHALKAFDAVDIIISTTDSATPPTAHSNAVISLNSNMPDLSTKGLLNYTLSSPTLGRYVWFSWYSYPGNEDTAIFWHSLDILELESQHSQHVIYGSNPLDNNQNLKICTECEAGTFKELNSNSSCFLCPVDTFQNESGALFCEACPANSGTFGNVGSTICACNAGYERKLTEYSCSVCSEAFFKPSHAETMCVPCSKCGRNERVKFECNTTHDTVCEPCQQNSVSPLNNSMRYCWCEEGYEFTNLQCEACGVGFFKSTNSNNSIMCAKCPADQFTDSIASSVCVSCRNTCPEGQFIDKFCSTFIDTKCKNCTVCQNGYYANPVCGFDHFEYRNDTNCSVCPRNHYCSGNSINPCMPNSHSHEQSYSQEQCVCDDGFYKISADNCAVCGYDNFCRHNLQHSCPANSVTLSVVSVDIHDCNCRHGFYRVWNALKTNFSCKLCEENDWCYDNQAYNCSDARMRSIHGSSSIDSCICEDGWYNANNNTKCLLCPVGYFCEEGRAFSCNDGTLYISDNATAAGNLWLQNRWTVNNTGSTSVFDCLCIAGLYATQKHSNVPIAHVAEICIQCPKNFYCPGNNMMIQCLPNTTSNVGSHRADDCVCDVGYETVGVNDSSCALCSDNTFKSVVGNEKCVSCVSCADSEFIASECVPRHNRICSNCNACDNGDIYTQISCTSITDAVCNNCSQCDYTQEYASPDCSPLHNRVCHNITRTCKENGFYAGHHTKTSNRECRNCKVTASPYFGMELHLFTSPGLSYGNAFSCNITCVPGSALVDARNFSRGCRSCEEGNLLLKRFPLENVDTEECEFECVSPYVRIGNDCQVSSLLHDRSQMLRVTKIEYLSDKFVFNLLHSNLGHYVILVGKQMTKCSRQNIAALESDGCCFHDLFRISTLSQMGRVADEHCSMRPLLPSTRVSADALTFEIADPILTTVANCTIKNGVQNCLFYITVLDLISSNSYSKSITIQKRRNYIFTYLNAPYEYIPLTNFEAEIQVALILSSGEKIYRAFWKAKSTQNLQIDIRVRGMSLYVLDAEQEELCRRISQEPIDNNSTSLYMPHDTFTRSLSYWRGNGDVVQLLLALQSDKHEIMDIAVVRNMSSLPAQCVQFENVVLYSAGNVFVASGLGRNAIYGMRLHDSTQIPYTHGKLGNLRTFLAVSATSATVHIKLKRILAVHLLNPAMYNDRMVHWVDGSPEFILDFQIWCLQNLECEYEYISSFDNLFFEMDNCSETSQKLARNWIDSQFSVANDAGHVQALCDRMDAQINPSKVFFIHAMRHAHAQLWNSKSLLQAKTFMWAQIQFITFE